MPRVLTFSTNISAGHKRAAEAVARAIMDSAPSAVIHAYDAMTLMGTSRRLFLTGAYLGIIRHRPDFWDWLYRNKRLRPRIEAFYRFLLARAREEFAAEIAEFDPDVVVCTQAIPARIIADLKARGRCTAPLLAVATDYGLHPYWADPAIDAYAVPCTEAAAELNQDGIPNDRIHVTGIPVDRVFERPPSREAARRALGLRPDGNYILAMGGGNGLGLCPEHIRAIETVPGIDGVIIIAGCNEKLAFEIQRLPQVPGRERYVMNMVEGMEKFYAAADYLVSKPGGLTMSEATAMRLAIIMIDPLPGQELRNAEFLLRSRSALMAETPAALREHLTRLTANPAERERLIAAAAAVGRPGASRRIASLALGLISDHRHARQTA